MLAKIKALFHPKKTAQSYTGRVKFFNRKKGYGFIESGSTEKDVFVHVTDLQDRVSKGDQVAFELEPSEKGLEAKKVKRIRNK